MVYEYLRVGYVSRLLRPLKYGTDISRATIVGGEKVNQKVRK